MIQFPIYTQVPPYQNKNVCYPPQTANIFQGGNVFHPAPPTNISEELENIHKNYYSDLTKEEFNASESVRNEMLYKSGKLEQLAKYGSWVNYGDTYNRIKDNDNFKEILNSKYLNSAKGFMRIMKNLNNLEEQRQKKMIPIPQIYGINIQLLPTLPYQKYDMNDYLKMLNNFIKNGKISDDLKQYFLYKESDKLDVYYTKLDKLDKAENPLDILAENF